MNMLHKYSSSLFCKTEKISKIRRLAVVISDKNYSLPFSGFCKKLFFIAFLYENGIL